MPELAEDPSVSVATLPMPEPVAAASVSTEYAFLYALQQEALKAWHFNARRGVIEAVTGAGKTRLGLAAAFQAVRQGIKVLILVPTAERKTIRFVTLLPSPPDTRASHDSKWLGGQDAKREFRAFTAENPSVRAP